MTTPANLISEPPRGLVCRSQDRL